MRPSVFVAMPDVLAPYAVLLKSQQQVSHAKLNPLFLTPISIPIPMPVLIPMLPGSPPSTKGQQKNKVFKCWAIIRKAGRLLAHKVVAEVFVLRALPKWVYGFICSCNGRQNARDLASSLRYFHILYFGWPACRGLIYELQIKLTTSRNLRRHPRIPLPTSSENSLILNTKKKEQFCLISVLLLSHTAAQLLSGEWTLWILIND